MNWQLPGIQRRTTAGVIGTSGAPIRVFSVHLVAGAGGAGQVKLYNGTTTSGTLELQLDTSAASVSNTLDFHMGIRFNSGCYIDAVSNVSYVTVVYQVEV